MSRKHPTHAELDIKAVNIQKERDKVSNFRPKLSRSDHVFTPEQQAAYHLRSPENIWKPSDTEPAQNPGPLAGTMTPIPRYGQIPFSDVRRAAKATHDARGVCSRPDCAFKNTSPEAWINPESMKIPA